MAVPQTLFNQPHSAKTALADNTFIKDAGHVQNQAQEVKKQTENVPSALEAARAADTRSASFHHSRDSLFSGDRRKANLRHESRLTDALDLAIKSGPTLN